MKKLKNVEAIVDRLGSMDRLLNDCVKTGCPAVSYCTGILSKAVTSYIFCLVCVRVPKLISGSTLKKKKKKKKNIHGKYLKISNIAFYTFLAKILLFIQYFLKILRGMASGMANIVDPDKTAFSGAV